MKTPGRRCAQHFFCRTQSHWEALGRATQSFSEALYFLSKKSRREKVDNVTIMNIDINAAYQCSSCHNSLTISTALCKLGTEALFNSMVTLLTECGNVPFTYKRD